MDIYHKISTITTGAFAQANTTKVKGVMFVNTNGSPSNVDLFPWGNFFNAYGCRRKFFSHFPN